MENAAPKFGIIFYDFFELFLLFQDRASTLIHFLENRLNRRLNVRREHSRPFDVPISVLDISRAREVLGWQPRLSFADGIERTMADLKENAALSILD